MPLMTYFVWETVILGSGIDDAMATAAGTGNTAAMIGGGGSGDGAVLVQNLIQVFSVCAVSSSMAGVSVSLVDFVQDALLQFLPQTKKEIPERSTRRVDEESQTFDLGGDATNVGMGTGTSATSTRWLAALFALGPPVVIAASFPDVFLTALEEAGLLGGVSLYGIIPAVSVLRLRQMMTMPTVVPPASSSREEGEDGVIPYAAKDFENADTAIVYATCGKDDGVLQDGNAATAPGGGAVGASAPASMPGRLPGGEVGLYVLASVSAGLVLPEIGRLLGVLK